MRVLFYHDPAAELGRPFLWKYFVEWAASMRRALPESECRFVMPDVMRRWAEEHGVPPGEIAEAREDELREAAGTRAANWNRHWYEGAFAEQESAGAASYVRSRLAGFVPDVILTHSPAPFLRLAFPGATVLHFEAGLLKFPPFPMSFYFDPDGFFGQSWLARNAVRLRSLTIDAGQQRTLDGLRKLFLDDLLAARSPFRAILAEEARRFRRLVLLPLQFGNFFGFDSHCRFRSQFEFARWVLERTPPDVGVVLTQHVYFERLEPEALEFLHGAFANLIHHPLFDDYHTASQFLLADVDAVVTVTSSVGMQSLWWRRPLIALGRSHLQVAADGCDPARVHEAIDGGWPPWKDALLYWLLTHYYVPSSYAYSAEWLPGFLDRMRGPGQEFGLIDKEGAVLERIAKGAMEDIGRPAGNPARAFEIAAQQRLEALNEMKAEAERRGRLIDELAAEVARRDRLIAEVSAEAGRRERLVKELSAEAERRLHLLQEASAEAERRASLIDELTAALRARDAQAGKPK